MIEYLVACLHGEARPRAVISQTNTRSRRSGQNPTNLFEILCPCQRRSKSGYGCLPPQQWGRSPSSLGCRWFIRRPGQRPLLIESPSEHCSPHWAFFFSGKNSRKLAGLSQEECSLEP
jgi:hypothetical protein